jgi:two-component system chemotaxis response regulator CheB
MHAGRSHQEDLALAFVIQQQPNNKEDSIILSRTSVLIVDDSAFFRQVLEDIISSDPDITIAGHARDGIEAIEKISLLKPDVVTMDFDMPRLDGLGCLTKIMDQFPTPVIMISSWTAEDTETTMRALELGAVDFIAKPSGTPDELTLSAKEIIFKVKVAARVNMNRMTRSRTTRKVIPGFTANSCDAIIIGTSTGGPKALQVFLEALPSPVPVPIIIAQHMPPGFTAALAGRLNVTTPHNVKELTNGEVLKDGWIYVCPSGLQTILDRNAGHLIARTENVPKQIYKPSIDLLNSSAAKVLGKRVAAVILTGMGSDGARGMLDIKNAGGITLAESEQSCVVYGMPKAAIDLGAAQIQAPLEEMAAALVEALQRKRK